MSSDPMSADRSADSVQLAVDTIKTLAMDGVQRANSGHPGMPMGMADLAVVLWTKFLVTDPDTPEWPDRDRFVLSNGHGSMLLYALLHVASFPMSIDDLKNFRQFGSPTPGHPEVEQQLGIETTTGPLGQGFGNAVGMAIAEAHLRAQFGSDLVDHHTYGFVSDGDLMEGVASEAASLAGHLGLGKLVYLYDDNKITLVGPTDLTYTEDALRRFDAYGWHTVRVDGHDRLAVEEAIREAKAEEERPSLISCLTHIGHGSPNKQDTAGAHGNPLGDEEIALVKENMGWSHPPFHVPDEVYRLFSDAMDKGRTARKAWDDRFGELTDADEELASQWDAYWRPGLVALEAPQVEPGSSIATRKAGGTALNEVALLQPGLIGGSADLSSSTNTLIAGSGDFSKKDRTARNLRFGVREHAMGSIVNGITLHGGLRGYGATFLTFSDYMRGAVRLSALMGVPSIWIWTHDSVFLGEDGPTHQPVEHLAALRAIPNLWVIRPADPYEASAAWAAAFNRTSGPTALVFTRQGLPVPDPTGVTEEDVARGAYIARDGTDAVLVGTGSEVWVALEAAEALQENGISLRVVSMPCVDAFLEQGPEVRASILGTGLPVASVEAGVTYGWSEITGSDGLRIGIDHFGASAPWKILAEEFGLTPSAVADKVEAWLAR